VVPIAPAHNEYACSVRDRMRKAGFFAEADLSSSRFPKKVRAAQLAQWNYILVVGDTERDSDSAAVRKRGTNAKDVKKIADVVTMLKAEVDEKPAQASTLFASVIDDGADEGKGGGKGSTKGSRSQGRKKKAGGGKKGGNDSNQDAFTKIDIRVGCITKAWPHPDSEKLWCEEIDLGEEHGPRQIGSGLRAHYPAECDMVGRKVLVVCNLKPAKLAGFKSDGMVLCAKSGDKVEFVEPPANAAVGERVTIEGFSGEPAAKSAVKKKKLWEAMAKDLRTDGQRNATWDGNVLMTSAGPCVVPSCANATIS